MTTSENVNLGPEWLRNRPVLSKFRYGAEEMLGLWACSQPCPTSITDQAPELAADQPLKPVSVSEEEPPFRGSTSERGRGRGRMSGGTRGGSTGQRRYDYNSRYYGNNDRNADSDNWRRRDPAPDITSNTSPPSNHLTSPSPGAPYYSPFSVPIATTAPDTATSIIDDKETNSWKRTGVPPPFTDTGSHGAVLRSISQTLESAPISTVPQPLFSPYTSTAGSGKDQMEFLKKGNIVPRPQDSNPISLSSPPSSMYSNPSTLSSHLPLSMGSPNIIDPGSNIFSGQNLKREPETFPSLAEIGNSLQQNQLRPSVTSPVPAEEKWFYLDPKGNTQGPFETHKMFKWFCDGYFGMDLRIRRSHDTEFKTLESEIQEYGRIPFQAPTEAKVPVLSEPKPSVPAASTVSAWNQGNIWGDTENISLNLQNLSPQYIEETQKKAAEEMKREIEQAMAEQKRKEEERRVIEKEMQQRYLTAKREEEQRQREELIKEELRQQKLFEEESEKLRLEKERLQKERLAQEERVRLELEEAERARLALEEERLKLEREREEVKKKEEEMRRLAEVERAKKEEENKRKAAERAAADAKALAKAQEEAKAAARAKAAAEASAAAEAAAVAAAKRNPWTQNTEPAVPQYDPWSNLQQPEPKPLSQVPAQQPKGWGKPGNNATPVSLSQIQKAEIQNKGNKSKPSHRPVDVPKPTQAGWGASSKKNTKSLAEIQKEEEAFNKEKQNYVYARQNEWNPVAGMLDEEVAAVKPSVTKSRNTENKQGNNKQGSTKKEVKQNKQNKQNTNKASTPLLDMFNMSNNNQSRDEFTVWCEQQVESFKNPYIDGPTFISFLNDIESPLVVREYVVSYLGDTKSTDEFIKEFVARRKLSNHKNSENDTGTSNGSSNNPGKKQGKQQQPQQTFSKKGKRKKMQKVNAAQLLGINCTASSDARNRGDIDTVVG